MLVVPSLEDRPDIIDREPIKSGRFVLTKGEAARDEPAEDLKPASSASIAPTPRVSLFESERQRANLNRVRSVGAVLVAANALAVLWRSIALSNHNVDPSRAMGLIWVHAISLPLAVFAVVASLDRFERVPWLVGYRSRVGEWSAMHVTALGACLSLLAVGESAKEPYPFALAALVTSALLVTRRWAQLTATVSMSVLMMVVTALSFGPRASVGTVILCLFFSIVADRLSRIVWDNFESNVALIEEYGRMGDELDAAVQEQTASLIAQTIEVERLNAVLNERVRETSRQLATALAKLAKGERMEPSFSPGAVIADRYEVVQSLGRGSMGVVYEAIDLATSSRVAVKVLETRRREDVDAMFRIIREAEVIATVDHPAIVKTEHVGVSNDGHFYIVLEYVRGRTLQAALSVDGKWPQDRVALLGATLFDALSVAHRAGITHRDVKPENIMVVSDAPGVKLLDFGLARVAEAISPTSTNREWILGTPAYLSPEQFLAPETVGPAADVYSTALVLYEALSGRSPYTADRGNEWVARHAFSEPVPISRLVAGLDVELSSLIMRCLSKSPADRPTADEAARALAALVRQFGSAPLDVVESARANKLARRRATPASGLNRVVKPIDPARDDRNRSSS